LRSGGFKIECCNAWDWEGFQFPSYGGVSTFKEVGITKKSRTFREVGIKKSRVRIGGPNPGHGG
jgi:hypothetical protein